jgi:hypothetical protein
MKKKLANTKTLCEIRIIVDQTVIDQIQKELYIDEYNKKTISAVVREALALYFQQKEKERLTVDTPIVIVSKVEPIEIKSGGLIIPTMPVVEPKPKPDPDIKASFSTDEISPGPGAVSKLRALGINPQSIINAKRAKAHGREYDKSLEQYFDLV